MQQQRLIYRSFGDPLACLALESAPLPPRPPGLLRVAMDLAPVNPSDLIPVSGAYAHRIRLPAIAGHEGVGRVIDAPEALAHLARRRVLPLRSAGTWQQFVDCDPDLAIIVPDPVDDATAARAYINPLAAMAMLERWPVAGRQVLLSGAGSMCSELLGRWARQAGATEVRGLCRSPARAARLTAYGIEPVPLDDTARVRDLAARAGVVFDSLGGETGSAVICAMRPGAVFVGYGLLTGEPIRPMGPVRADYRRFHLRDHLAGMDAPTWQDSFRRIWARLAGLDLPKVKAFPLAEWKSAVLYARQPGAAKPMLILGARG